MRVVVVCFAALLLSSCAWVRHEIGPAPAPPAAVPPPAAKPDTPKPPRKPHVERAAPPQVQSAAPVAPAAAPPPDYSGRCHAMAQNRADDAKQLGADAADQAKMLGDTYRDCMAQSR